MAIDTGHGATLTFSGSSLSFNWVTINAGGKSISAVDTSHLGTTGVRTNMAGDLTDEDVVTITYQMDNTDAEPGLGTTETLTITAALASGESIAGNLAGTGRISRIGRPTYETDTLKIGEIDFTWDGATDPAWTAAT